MLVSYELMLILLSKNCCGVLVQHLQKKKHEDNTCRNGSFCLQLKKVVSSVPTMHWYP